MITFVRFVLFIVCLWFSLLPYAQLVTWLQPFQPASHDAWIAVPWLVLTTVVPAALVAAAACLPIAWAFGRSAPWVALCLTAPFVALTVHHLRPNATGRGLALACASMAAYVVFVVGATVLARRYLARRGAGGDPPSAAIA